MPTNFGRKLPLTKLEAQAIQRHLQYQKRWRDLALFMLGVDSLLRSSDLLKLRMRDVTDNQGNIRTYLSQRQKKTRRPVECYLSEPTREVVAHWISISDKSANAFLFTRLKSRKDINTSISSTMYRLLVKQWVEAIGLDPSRYSTKSLRKSRVRPILEAANHDYQVPQILLGHADIRSTIHYAAIAEETALAVSAQVQFFTPLHFEPSPQPSGKSGKKFDETTERRTK